MDSYIINDINIDVLKKQKRQKEDENKPLSRLNEYYNRMVKQVKVNEY